MDELYFDNKKYVTTKKAAALANYAKDYVGQLARSGKIDARLIGRNWYISEEALIEHAFGPTKRRAEEDGVDVLNRPESAQNIPTKEDSVTESVVLANDGQFGQAGDSDTGFAAEPIQNYGLNTENEGVESRLTETEFHAKLERPVDESEISISRYSHDDSDLYPPLRDPYTHDTDVVDSTVDSEHEYHNLAETKQGVSYEDVSKITLTLRSRVNNTQQLTHRFQQNRLGSERESSANIKAGTEVLGAAFEKNNNLRSKIATALIVLALAVSLFTFTYYSFSSQGILYNRDESAGR